MFKKLLLAAMAIGLLAPDQHSTTISMDKSIAGPFDKQWAMADSLKEAGLPQQALPVVDAVYAEARKTKNQPVMIKAILYKIALWSSFEEDHLKKGIALIDEEIKTADMPMFSILHSMQGQMYSRYFEMNRYLMLRRTILASKSGSDIDTWDARATLNKASAHYQLSLKDSDELKKTDVADFYEIIEKRVDSKRNRPTLFDLLGHRALDFYMREESYQMPATKTFDIDKEAYFGDARTFANLEIEKPGEENFLYHATEVMRQLTGLHLNRVDPVALVDIDLKRLAFVREKSNLANKDDLYLKALEQLEANYNNKPVFAGVAYALATFFEQEGRTYDPFTNPQPRLMLIRAKEKCEAAISKFPDEPATINCRILLENLLKQHLSAETEYVNLPGKSFKASVVFRNTPIAYFRILKIDPEQDRKLRESRQKPEEIMKAYLAMPVIRQWKQALPPNDDLQQHRSEIAIAPLPAGYYVMLIGQDSELLMADHNLSRVSFWVSSISFMHRDLGNGSTEIYVLHRNSGKPMHNVTAITYNREYQPSGRTYELKKEQTFTTNRNGSFVIPASEKQDKYSNLIVEFKTAKDRLITDNYFYQYRQDPVRNVRHLQTHLFTDRAIYRPGQTVYYKGIVVESDGETHRTANNIRTTVALHNTNYEKIAEQVRTSNEFGSFSGSFVLPLSGLNGHHQIITQYGSVGFTVDEYRLPRFEVVFDTLRESYKLGQMITVTGQAKAYAGNAVGNAEVTFRVTRQARFPFWRYWARPYFPVSPAAEIMNGTVKTDPDGKFSITFQAIADPKIPKDQLPVFIYSISADATDIQGETQSGNLGISVGYKALLLETNVEQNLNRDSFQGFDIKATNLNGQPQEATVEMTIQKLKNPEKLLRSRLWAQPDQFVMNKKDHDKLFPHDVYGDDKNPEMWEIEKEMLSEKIFTGSRQAQLPETFRSWEPGVYRMVLKARDVFGETIEQTRHFTLFSPVSVQMPTPEIWFMAPIVIKGKPGEKAQVLLGSSLNLNVLMEVELKGKIIETRRIQLKNNTLLIEVPIKKEHTGGFRILFNAVALNRAFNEALTVEVPDAERQLNIALESMRTKLEPGSKEEWSIIVKDGENNPAMVELLAGMYDAGLDAIVPHAWALNVSERGYRWMNWSSQYAFGLRSSNYFLYEYLGGQVPYFREYDLLNWFGFIYHSDYRFGREEKGVFMRMQRTDMATDADGLKSRNMTQEAGAPAGAGEPPETNMDPGAVAKTPPFLIRRDFRETAFFFPHLKTDKTGATKVQFTLPESLTRWKMMGLAHDKSLRKGNFIQEFEASRQVMVVSNAPRFFRQGDQTVFRAKVVNTTNELLEAGALLELFDATTMQPVDSIYGLAAVPVRIKIQANSAIDVGWDINIPAKGPFALVYRVRAMAGTHSDGEENMLPVLTNRQLVTESMPLFVNAGESRSFSLTKLLETGKQGTTPVNHKLTLEFTTNPIWYAVQALPYLAEPSYKTADALFHRFYANRLASYIINGNPEIERIFDVWSKTQPDALLSNLEKNQDLKNIVIGETPWLMDARRESENKRKISLMFDRSSIDQVLIQSGKDLLQMQLDNGGWPWMPGMPDNQYITARIVAGFGRLKALGAIDFKDYPEMTAKLQKAVYYLDDRMVEELERMTITEGGKYLNHGAIQYLWARSYFTADYPLREKQAQMHNFWIGQATKYWLEQPIYMQGMIALVLHRAGKDLAAQQIIKSLKNKSLYNLEMGMYWRDLQPGYFWHQAPVEAQSLLIEAFSTVANDAESVQKMQQWLVKQKQTQAWKTNRATAEAIYAILMQGRQTLASNKDITIRIGKTLIDPSKDPSISEEAGSGYFRISWNPAEIKPEMAKITISNKGKSIGWGGLYWQYFERLDRITYHETPLKLNRKIMKQSLTSAGPVLEEINSKTPLKTGDKMVMRIELRVDRDMEFVHMKDLRAPAFEPINQLSQYKYQDGLGYYENPRDAATHFFFQYLPKGTYVFEYPVFVSQTGNFSSGITTIECLYAPEFKAHSEGIRISILKR